MNLKNRSFISLLDFSAAEIEYLLQLAHELKAKRQQGISGTSLAGKNIALLFEKTSTRTRCAFEIGVIEEGGYPSFIDVSSSQFGKKESVEDSAKVLGGFYHGIEFRGYSQQTVETLAKFSGVPVYNGLTDAEHPTQILADLMTIQELFPNKPLSDIKVAYVGDARNNMANAWIYGCALLGMHFVAYAPPELSPDSAILAKAAPYAKHSQATIEVCATPKCLVQADVIYTDVWVSMGEEAQIEKRAKLLQSYKITPELMKQTGKPDSVFMHCLPAFHDNETKFVQDAAKQLGVDIREVSDEVFRGSQSVVFQQAHNRLHTIKAILVATLGQV